MWGSIFIKNAIDLIFEDDETHEPAKLKANGMDVHHGKFTDPQDHENEGFLSKSNAMIMDLNGAKCKYVRGLPLEVNTIFVVT